jgi:hypothetical protein
MDLGGGGGGKAGGGAGGGSDNPWDQQLLSLQRGLQKVEGLALHAQGGTPRPASARLPARSPRGGGTPRQGARRPQDPLVAALSSF